MPAHRKFLLITFSAFLSACTGVPRIEANKISFIDKESVITTTEYREFHLNGKIVAEISSERDLLEFGKTNKYQTYSEVFVCSSKKRMTGNFLLNPINISNENFFSYFVIVDYKTDTNDPAIGTGRIDDYNLAQTPRDICLQVKFGGIGKLGRSTNKVVFEMKPDLVAAIRKYNITK